MKTKADFIKKISYNKLYPFFASHSQSGSHSLSRQAHSCICYPKKQNFKYTRVCSEHKRTHTRTIKMWITPLNFLPFPAPPSMESTSEQSHHLSSGIKVYIYHILFFPLQLLLLPALHFIVNSACFPRLKMWHYTVEKVLVFFLIPAIFFSVFSLPLVPPHSNWRCCLQLRTRPNLSSPWEQHPWTTFQPLASRPVRIGKSANEDAFTVIAKNRQPFSLPEKWHRNLVFPFESWRFFSFSGWSILAFSGWIYTLNVPWIPELFRSAPRVWVVWSSLIFLGENKRNFCVISVGLWAECTDTHSNRQYLGRGILEHNRGNWTWA